MFRLSFLPRLFPLEHLSCNGRSARTTVRLYSGPIALPIVESFLQPSVQNRCWWQWRPAENCATKENIERSLGAELFSFVAKESSHRRWRRFQFPPMWSYIERNAGRGVLIPAGKRHGAVPRRCCRGSPRLNWKQTCVSAEKGGNATVIPLGCAHHTRERRGGRRRRRRRRCRNVPLRDFIPPGSRGHV